MDKTHLKKYKTGTFLNCSGIRGIIVFPRKENKISVAWQGMDNIDDYQPKWLKENCLTDEEYAAKRFNIRRY